MPIPKLDITFSPRVTGQQGVFALEAIKKALKEGYEAGLAGAATLPAVAMTIEPTTPAADIKPYQAAIAKAAAAGYAAGLADREEPTDG